MLCNYFNDKTMQICDTRINNQKIVFPNGEAPIEYLRSFSTPYSNASLNISDPNELIGIPFQSCGDHMYSRVVAGTQIVRA